jgi:hypothetical protein
LPFAGFLVAGASVRTSSPPAPYLSSGYPKNGALGLRHRQRGVIGGQEAAFLAAGAAAEVVPLAAVIAVGEAVSAVIVLI